jgi:hypothetical protein
VWQGESDRRGRQERRADQGLGDCHKRPRPLTLRLSWRDVNGSRGLRKHLCELINQARHREGDALGSVNLLGERQRRAQRCHSAADIAPVTGVGAL